MTDWTETREQIERELRMVIHSDAQRRVVMSAIDVAYQQGKVDRTAEFFKDRMEINSRRFIDACVAADRAEKQKQQEWDEKRIDIISQNGNDGLHY